MAELEKILRDILWNDKGEDFYKEATDVIEKVKRLEEENRWIPVTERLPEKEGGSKLYEVICDGHILESCFYKDTWLHSYSHWRSIVLPP